jgi:hypothetical protein
MDSASTSLFVMQAYLERERRDGRIGMVAERVGVGEGGLNRLAIVASDGGGVVVATTGTPGNIDASKTRHINGKGRKCNICQKYNHTKKDCPSKAA